MKPKPRTTADPCGFVASHEAIIRSMHNSTAGTHACNAWTAAATARRFILAHSDVRLSDVARRDIENAISLLSDALEADDGRKNNAS